MSDRLHLWNLSDVTWPNDAVFIVDRRLGDICCDAVGGPIIYVDSGEALKSLDAIGKLAADVLARRSTRPLTLVGIGGGSVGDAVGFLASTLWRGVDLWHVPTTLLAMVDSAHGGKTAVNLAGRKNQLGTFYPADTVVICREFLGRLPLDLREEGLVELLKVLWIEGADELEWFDDENRYHRILSGPVSDDESLWRRLVDCAIDAKMSVVTQDPEETTGHRRVLNLGHTAGHALEAMYGLPHARAVAWGLAGCAELSTARASLSDAAAARLFSHVSPLLCELPTRLPESDFPAFRHRLRGDKKRCGGELISVLVDDAGDPVQTRDVDARDWWNAMRAARDRWKSRTVCVLPANRLITDGVELPVDKSRANRAAVIDYLRLLSDRDGESSRAASENSSVPDEEHSSAWPAHRRPRDVAELSDTLRRLADAETDEPVDLPPVAGGTTGRFLLAVAADRRGPTRVRFTPQLRRRPHDPLVDSLTDAGAAIERTDSGFEVVGWTEFPQTLCIDSSRSSQFASALALLGAGGRRFELQLQGSVASRPYFDMTLKMLRRAGVKIEQPSQGVFVFSPGEDSGIVLSSKIPPDTSSAVVWKALSFLDGGRFEAPALDGVAHPDRAFDDVLERLSEANGSTVEVDLSSCPDLAPVLAATAVSSPPAVEVTGASHLRDKESNRIDELADAFREAGIDIAPTDDGFRIPSGVQTARKTAKFAPRGDHRLAMAAVVLAHAGEGLRLVDAGCVGKSYPGLWRYARRAGMQIGVR